MTQFPIDFGANGYHKHSAGSKISEITKGNEIYSTSSCNSTKFLDFIYISSN